MGKEQIEWVNEWEQQRRKSQNNDCKDYKYKWKKHTNSQYEWLNWFETLHTDLLWMKIWTLSDTRGCKKDTRRIVQSQHTSFIAIAGNIPFFVFHFLYLLKPYTDIYLYTITYI